MPEYTRGTEKVAGFEGSLVVCQLCSWWLQVMSVVLGTGFHMSKRSFGVGIRVYEFLSRYVGIEDV